MKLWGVSSDISQASGSSLVIQSSRGVVHPDIPRYYLRRPQVVTNLFKDWLGGLPKGLGRWIPRSIWVYQIFRPSLEVEH